MKADVEVEWSKHHGQVSRDCHVQITLLVKAQVESIKSETKIGNLQGIIRGSTNTAMFALGLQPGSNSAMGLTSQAKQTLRILVLPSIRPSLVLILALMLESAMVASGNNYGLNAL